MATKSYSRRFVVTLEIHTSRKDPASDYMLQHDIRRCLSNLNQKEYGIGEVYADAVPLSGFKEKALDFLEGLIEEMGVQADDRIVSHLECDHD